MRAAGLIAIVVLVNTGCGIATADRVDPSLRDQIIQLVVEAETNRLEPTTPHLDRASMSDWIEIIIERTESKSFGNITFATAANTQIDPPAVYVIAYGPDRSLFRIGGFSDRHEGFDALIRGLMRDGRAKPEDALPIVNAYFEVVEGWRPGVVSRRRPLPYAGTCRTRVLGSTGQAMSVVALVEDTTSGRAECVKVEVSPTKGVEVLERKVLRNGQRIEM